MVLPSPLSDNGAASTSARIALQISAESYGGRTLIEPRLNSFSVLMVGLNDESRQKIEEALNGTDFVYRFAPGFDGAVATVTQDKSIGVIVLDQEEVRRSGSHLAFELRQHAKRPVSIVPMVRELTFELTEALLKAGAAGILGFPLTSEDIVRVVTAAANACRSGICREESVETAIHIIKDALGSNDAADYRSALASDRVSGLPVRGMESLGSCTDQIPSAHSNTPSSKSIKSIHRFFRDVGAALDFVNVDNSEWLMLIDLLLVETEDCQIGVTALCTGVGVPVTTALKRLDELSAAGLVERIPDVVDRRRIFVCLTQKGRACVLSMIERLEQTLTIAAFAPEFDDSARLRHRHGQRRAG